MGQEDRQEERRGATGRLGLADAQFPCHRLETARLGEHIGEWHGPDS
jgi:hypothetical protein